MKELLDKFSSYNIFNYIFPGVTFVFLTDMFTQYSLIVEDIFVGVFIYYFIGLIISRVGSLFLEPLLTKIRFLPFKFYEKFILASKKDSKLELLSEVNNMYRTLASLFLCLIIFIGYEKLRDLFPSIFNLPLFLLLVLFLFLFIISFRKQTKYISSRIETINKLKNDNNQKQTE